MKLFARSIDHLSGKIQSRPPEYMADVRGWSKGATLFKWQLKRAFDSNGVIVDELEKVLQHIPAGYTISYDIQQYGFNQTPKSEAVFDLHADFISAAKKIRPDLFHGFFSVFCENGDDLFFPEGSLNRARFQWNQRRNKYLLELAKLVDFIAPQFYFIYEGEISRKAGFDQNPEYFLFWEDGDKYGFEEWANHYDWLMNIAVKWNKPVYPYIAPYGVLNNKWGGFGGKSSFDWAVTYFRPALDHVSQTAAGCFFFDRAEAAYICAVDGCLPQYKISGNIQEMINLGGK